MNNQTYLADMEIIEYLDLTDEQQMDILYEQGEWVDSCKTFDAEYHLFAISKFFIELTLNPGGYQVQRLSPFVNGKRLDKYTKSLDRSKKPWE